MPRTRYLEADAELVDPVVEIHESELRALQNRAKFALPGAIVAVLAMALIAAGIVRVERSIRQIDAAAADRTGAIAKELRSVNEQMTARTDSELIGRIAMESTAAPIAGAASTAQRALAVAREAAKSYEPVTEQFALVDGRLVQIQAGIDELSSADGARAQQIADLARNVDVLRSDHQERMNSVVRRLSAIDSRIEHQDREANSTKAWTRVAAVGAAMGIGMAASHALDHSGRE